MLTLFDGDSDFTAVSLEGRSWNLMQDRFPAEGRFEGQPCTLSSAWLFRNFRWICTPTDWDDIRYAKSFRPTPAR